MRGHDAPSLDRRTVRRVRTMIRAQAARSSIEKGRPAATVRRRGETCSKDRGRRDRIIEPSQDRRKSFRTRSTGRRRGRRKEGGGGRRSNRPAAQRKASRIATDRQRSPGSRPDTATDRQERGDKSGPTRVGQTVSRPRAAKGKFRRMQIVRRTARNGRMRAERRHRPPPIGIRYGKGLRTIETAALRYP